ncbi:ABATE domain-containing protein [Streptomyces sp. NPDC050263]|uniref:ABATE domain-containing protein n=1 Tax=Streptomyces sp. NPDC050263 TaxID=3155037 RepID=UPI00343A51B0
MRPARPVRRRHGLDRDPAVAFTFIGGRPCLDSVATLGRRHTTEAERLPDPTAPARWIEEAGPGAAPEPAPEPAPVTARDLTDARGPREAVYGLVRAAPAGREPESADGERVNATAARPHLAPRPGDPRPGPGQEVREP